MITLDQWERDEIKLPDDDYEPVYRLPATLCRHALDRADVTVPQLLDVLHLRVVGYRGKQSGVVLPPEFGEVLEQ